MDAQAPEEATPTHVAAPHRARRRRVRTALLVLLSLVIVFIVVSVVLTLEGRARPVSLSQAISRYHSDAASVPGTHPLPGVYSYQGTGTDSLSLPPLSQAEGPTLPGTVEVQKDGCWTFRIDYSTNHWQSWAYCGRPTGLVETGGLVWQRWMIGPVAETNLSTLRCSPGLISIPSAPAVDKSWAARCTGTSTQIHGTLATAGATRFVGQPILTIAGHKIPTVHVEVQWRLMGHRSARNATICDSTRDAGSRSRTRRIMRVRSARRRPDQLPGEREYMLHSLSPQT